jgi:hypothetical protein
MGTQSKAQSEWYQRNKEEHKAKTKVRNKERRERFHALKQQLNLKCEFCGETDVACLDFHHKNPKEKERTVGRMHTCSIEAVMAEIAKCQVLCANCHRKLHAGRFD